MRVLIVLAGIGMFALRFFGTLIRLGFRLLRYALGLALLLFLMQGSTFLTSSEWNAIGVMVSRYQFDYIGWELNALAVKADETLYGLHPFMGETDRSQYVRAYMADLQTAQQLEAQIATLFADPSVRDPKAASADLRARRDQLRASLQQRQPLVESILEGQVATVLVDQGFGIGGQLFPPIAMHFTQVPDLLVVSPRDQIRLDVAINLYSLPVEQADALENRLDQDRNVSSLIVPLGGIALYPAMILETPSIPFAVETFAHEWLHHYLFFFPLGFDYFTGTDAFAGETRIINETTANLFGNAVGRLVLARYYPDLLPQLPLISPPTNAPPSTLQPAPAFDYGKEMNTTRVTVDQLLADGKVSEAEAYMEERRKLFVAHGYAIRKLNQAFFAFYGGYQSGTPGVGGEDPIGPAVQAIRDASPSIQAWIVTMRGITTREQLLKAAGKS